MSFGEKAMDMKEKDSNEEGCERSEREGGRGVRREMRQGQKRRRLRSMERCEEEAKA